MVSSSDTFLRESRTQRFWSTRGSNGQGRHMTFHMATQAQPPPWSNFAREMVRGLLMLMYSLKFLFEIIEDVEYTGLDIKETLGYRYKLESCQIIAGI